MNTPYAAEAPLPEWPEEERPRERLLDLGPRVLSEAELLALLLRSGTRGMNALGLARRIQALVRARGGWLQVQAADLCSLPGLGPAKAATLMAALELGRRAGQSQQRNVPLSGPEASLAALRELLGGRREEHFAVLALDARRRVLAAELISQGTLTQTMAHPREVFRSAIKLGAASVVVGHNHPSGDPSPSPDDRLLTRRLREAAEVLAVPLLDHVIVGEPGHYSFSASGWV
jgi:DNA repair protein RadC